MAAPRQSQNIPESLRKVLVCKAPTFVFAYSEQPGSRGIANLARPKKDGKFVVM